MTTAEDKLVDRTAMPLSDGESFETPGESATSAGAPPAEEAVVLSPLDDVAALNPAEARDVEALVPSPGHEAVGALKDHVTAEVGKLVAVFNDKLAYDRFKEEQITRLHDELKAYKADLLFESMKPLVNGLIRLHDDMAKVAESVAADSPEAAGKPVTLIAGFQEDIEILLAEVDVVPYCEGGTEFNPRRQQSIRTVATPDLAQVGQVARHLRPGFARGERIVRKEKVSVYMADPNTRPDYPETSPQGL